MKRSVWLWIIAILITLVMGRWQRMTGPTHELSGTASLGGSSIHYVLDRTHVGPGDHRIALGTLPVDVTGVTEWKEYSSNDAWTAVEMRRAAAPAARRQALVSGPARARR
jgi:hypothetical protein